jgi:hypothetical protein
LVLIGFFDLAQFFSRSARFFSGLGSIRFFWFQAYKTKIEPNRSVFQNSNRFNWFFSRFGFFSYFFSSFLGLISFLIFLLPRIIFWNWM